MQLKAESAVLTSQSMALLQVWTETIIFLHSEAE